MTRTLVATIIAISAAQAAVIGQFTFRSGVDAVRVDVSVTRGGRPVAGLTADDFDVTDAGVPQRVADVSVDSQSVSVFLVLDTSGSVAGGVMRDLVRAAQTLVAALRPADRAALITFSTAAAVPAPLTADLSSVRSALNSLRAEGNTALRDAVFTALQLLPNDGTRPIVLVFTDGCDSASWLSATDVVAATRRTPVVVHAIVLGDVARDGARAGFPICQSLSGLRADSFLDSLVDAAGGRLWSAATSGRLEPLFTQALDEMRARYVLTYYPQNPARDGWHELKVRLKRGRADIKARPGYFVIPRIQEPGVTR